MKASLSRLARNSAYGGTRARRKIAPMAYNRLVDSRHSLVERLRSLVGSQHSLVGIPQSS